MKISVENQNGVVLVTVGELRLTAEVAQELRDTLTTWIGGQVTRVIIDLSAVTIMDSTGLGALVGVVKTAGAPRVVALAGANPPVATLLRLARMDKVFRIFGSVPEALEGLDAQP
jgi:anti-sigma B factor antagonist